MDAYDFEPTTSRKQFKSPKIKKEDKYFYKKPSTPIKSRKHERRESLQRDEATLKRYATRKAQRLDHRTSEYSCLICKTNDILNYKTYNNHMEKHKLQKDPPPHTCATCSREFYKIYAYINHKCAVRQKCFICNTEVQCFARLNFHLRKEHMNEKLEWLESLKCFHVIINNFCVIFSVRNASQTSRVQNRCTFISKAIPKIHCITCEHLW